MVGLGLREARDAVVAVPKDLDAATMILLQEAKQGSRVTGLTPSRAAAVH